MEQLPKIERTSSPCIDLEHMSDADLDSDSDSDSSCLSLSTSSDLELTDSAEEGLFIPIRTPPASPLRRSESTDLDEMGRRVREISPLSQFEVSLKSQVSEVKIRIPEVSTQEEVSQKISHMEPDQKFLMISADKLNPEFIEQMTSKFRKIEKLHLTFSEPVYLGENVVEIIKKNIANLKELELEFAQVSYAHLVSFLNHYDHLSIILNECLLTEHEELDLVTRVMKKNDL